MPPSPALVRWVGKGVDYAVIGIGGAMAALIFVNVVLHAFHKDLAWLTELGEFMMVWVTFLGGAAASQRGAHMCINEFLDKLMPAAGAGPMLLCNSSPWSIWLWCCSTAYRIVQGSWGTADHARVAHGLAVHAFAGGLGADSPVHRVGPDPDRCAVFRAISATP
jgi:TRAP-type C4-dicarboxylate transport system permease small subunit